MLLNFIKNDIISTPFPYCIKNGVLDASLYNSLKNEFPSTTHFGKSNIYHGGRLDIAKGDIRFKNFLEDSPAWGNFYKKINSQSFIDYCINLFSLNLDELDTKLSGKFIDSFSGHSLFGKVLNKFYLDNIYKKYLDIISFMKNNPLYIDFVIYKSRGGYSREIHTDNRHKLLLFTFYLSSKLENNEGGEFEIYEHLHPPKLAINYERFPAYDKMKRVKTILPDDNVGLILLNTNNSYHAVSKVKNSDNYNRNTCYISIAAKKKIWKGQPTQLF